MNWLDKIKCGPEGLNRAEACMGDLIGGIQKAHFATVQSLVPQGNPTKTLSPGLAKASELMDVELQKQARRFARLIWQAATVETIGALSAQHGATDLERAYWALRQIDALVPDAAEGSAT